MVKRLSLKIDHFQWMLLFLWCQLLLGCSEAFTGKLIVHDTFSLVNTESQSVRLSPGTYSADVQVDESSNTLVLTLKDASDLKQAVRFDVPAGVHIPAQSGRPQ